MALSSKMIRADDGKFATAHGKSRTRLYTLWGNMLHRCRAPTCKQFPDYGGRGISVCQRWIDSFEAFVADIGPRPPGGTVERNDVNGNYEPSNCRWATAREQANNRRNTIRVGGMTLGEIAQVTGLPISAVKNRYRRGWSADKILSQPRREYPESSHARY